MPFWKRKSKNDDNTNNTSSNNEVEFHIGSRSGMSTSMTSAGTNSILGGQVKRMVNRGSAKDFFYHFESEPEDEDSSQSGTSQSRSRNKLTTPKLSGREPVLDAKTRKKERRKSSKFGSVRQVLQHRGKVKTNGSGVDSDVSSSSQKSHTSKKTAASSSSSVVFDSISITADQQVSKNTLEVPTINEEDDRRVSVATTQSSIHFVGDITALCGGSSSCASMDDLDVPEGDQDDENDEEEQAALDDKENRQLVLDKIKEHEELITKLRSFPWPLKRKVKVLKAAKTFIERYEGKLRKKQRTKFREARKAFTKKSIKEVNEFAVLVTPWELTIKQIESHFGSAVASYFIFLRWIVMDNIINVLIVVALVVLPELILHGDEHGKISGKMVPPDELTSAWDLDTIFNFGGFIGKSPLFYGYYVSDTTSLYKVPVAYLLVMLVVFGFGFVRILRKMAKNSRLARQAHSKDEQFSFTWRLFCSWDFSIGNSETAANKVAEISNLFRELIVDAKEQQKVLSMSIVVRRILANVIVVLILSSSAYLVITMAGLEATTVNSDNSFDVFWHKNGLSIVLSLITVVYPSLFEYLGLMEGYHPRTSMKWQLVRILILYLLNLYSLMFGFYYKFATKNLQDRPFGSATDQFNATTARPGLLLTRNCTTADNSSYGCNATQLVPEHLRTVDTSCWENDLAEEMYKITTIDLLTTLASIVAIDYVRGVFVRFMNPCWCWDLERRFPEYGEFKIADCILHLIYNQGMVWMGTFFAPGLPVLNMVKLVIMMYFRAWAAKTCNVPLARVFYVSRSSNVYLVMLLFMLFLCMVPTMFCILVMRPSETCGPFRGHDTMYHVLIEWIETFPQAAQDAIKYAILPGVTLPLFVLLGLFIYYLLSMTQSLKTVNAGLKANLKYERTEGRKKIYAMAEGAIAKPNEDEPTADLDITANHVNVPPASPLKTPFTVTRPAAPMRAVMMSPAQAFQAMQLHQLKLHRDILELKLEVEKTKHIPVQPPLPVPEPFIRPEIYVRKPSVAHLSPSPSASRLGRRFLSGAFPVEEE